ncbi:two-component system response regulator [Rhizobium altiplani]|uniref:Two-component system response regulator n=1 Tax=Rhizobium altiplani TaxID=1864509 RepID=A0A120FPZ1_9HYPH|nr:response regulator [Rhizobium altiplani]KWV57737.1 two-component system response regulator [Rhizobium altiplani]
MTVKVLIVDDEPLVRMLAVDVVEEAGFEAVEARDADEAIRLLEVVDGIRILLTDVDMPGSMDGLRLAAAVRERWPPIRIVVVSGKKRPAEEALPDGIFFAKPYDVDKMTEQLQKLAA